MANAGAIANFSSTGNSTFLKFKQKITGGTADGGKENFEILVPLKYSSKFKRNLEIPIINCEINSILTWSEKCVLSNDAKATTFAKLYVPVVTLSTQDNVKLLQ